MIVFIFHDSWVQLFPSEIFSTVLTTDVRQFFFLLLNQPFSLKIVETFD